MGIIGAVSGLGVGIATDIIDYKRGRRQSKDIRKTSSPNTLILNEKMKPTASEQPGPASPALEAQALTAVMSREQTIGISLSNEPVKLQKARTFQRFKNSSPAARLSANLATHAGRGEHRRYYRICNPT